MRRLIDQANTLETSRPYAKTANCAIRREAFEQIGGFEDRIRSGGDADVCFRLAAAAWEFELRPDALVCHRSRHRLIDLLGQRARHGSGAEWLEQRYPGFVGPRRQLPRLGVDIARGAMRSVLALARRNGESALTRALDPVSNAAFELGRRVPNTTWRIQRPTIGGYLR
jgi:GT2 family glycosyltransferase